MSLHALALDKSVRSKTVEGHLCVETSPLSKACVSPYFGKEIPNFDVLGLDPDKLYFLLRDPVELAKAAPSFAGIPILFAHQPVTADDHPSHLTVGSVGTDVEFNDPYLEASLRFWRADAIAGVETKTQTEISSGYRYRADMTPGVYQGVPYDGVMRDIQGNHIALVDVGRAGPDVVVQDKQPLQMRTLKMPTKKLHLSPLAAAVNGALRAYLTPKLAQDAAIGSLGELLVGVKDSATLAKHKPEILAKVRALMGNKLAADAKMDDMDTALDAADDDDMAADAEEETPEDKKKREEAEAAALAKSGAKDVDPDTEPKVGKGAMDAAIAAAVLASQAQSNALYQARKDVAHIVGEVALDSAEAVYAFALTHLGVDTKGVHPSAYPSMLKLAQDKKPATVIAQDASSALATAKQFPHLARINHI